MVSEGALSKLLYDLLRILNVADSEGKVSTIQSRTNSVTCRSFDCPLIRTSLEQQSSLLIRLNSYILQGVERPDALFISDIKAVYQDRHDKFDHVDGKEATGASMVAVAKVKGVESVKAVHSSQIHSGRWKGGKLKSKTMY